MKAYTTEVPDSGAWKFVKVDDEYRFLDARGMSSCHNQAVKDGEMAISAGMIGVYKDGWTIVDHYSMSLKVGIGEKDIEDLTRLLGRPFIDT